MIAYLSAHLYGFLVMLGLVMLCFYMGVAIIAPVEESE